MPFYAVAKGKKSGIYSSWPDCQDQITGFKGAVYKKFGSEQEAKLFIQERTDKVIDNRSVSKKEESSSNGAASKEKDNKGDKAKGVASIGGDASAAAKRRNSDDTCEKGQKKTKLSECEKKSMEINDDGYLVVYTDGACEFNGRNGARAGIGVYFGPENAMNVSKPVLGRATNNTAEIQAATSALKQSKILGYDKILLNTDSQFLINCMTSWLKGWKKNDWKKKDGAEVINKLDLMDLETESQGLMVKWNHVKAHNGIPGNETADFLAREGAKLYKKPESD